MRSTTGQRALVSHDVGTMPAHFRAFRNARKRSIVVFLVPQSLDVGTAIEELLLIWLASEAAEWASSLRAPPRLPEDQEERWHSPHSPDPSSGGGAPDTTISASVASATVLNAPARGLIRTSFTFRSSSAAA